MIRILRKRIKHNFKVLRYVFTNFRNIINFSKAAPDNSETENVPTMTAFEAKEKLDNDELIILDIRSQRDFEDAHIMGSIQIEIFDVLDNLAKLPNDKEIGVICYGGGGSMTVTKMLMNNGYAQVKNVEGGIIRYALDVDNTLLELF
ncbi:MAG: rhodanese-like domain-containing protein [Candidatus Hodarchaeales archaeon]